MALLRPLERQHRAARILLVPLGLFGAALLYGDGTITPAISVLSAIEGLGRVHGALEVWIVPLTILILASLFFFQRHGTQRIGSVFGPVMCVWFLVLAVLGVRGILLQPAVLAAVNPLHALTFFQANGMTGYLVLGTIFLVVTGGEALYADMGHFGLGPIRLSWFGVVLPALLLNYFGQGALILTKPAEAAHPFFDLAPAEMRLALVVLATLATIIASQAVITGTFSLTAQAVRLGMLPGMKVVHTSATERGQIYIPLANWLLMAATIGLVLGFGSSDRLGAAYGLSVSTDMAITTLLAAVVAWRHWQRPWLAIIGVLTIWIVDWAFLGANLFKFFDGGWYPLLVGVLVFTVMTTWRRGRRLVLGSLDKMRLGIPEFLASAERERAHTIPGTGVFLARYSEGVPAILRHHLARNRVLNEQVVLLTLRTDNRPRVPARERVAVQRLADGLFRVVMHYGYMQTPNIPVTLRGCERLGLVIDLKETTYYLGIETVIPRDDAHGMAYWRERLFALITRNAQRAAIYYGLPTEQVVELGIQIEI
ncbi:MAG: KUP/HAK/KT family potassium transporter [Gammaproteobacteria bacterium]